MRTLAALLLSLLAPAALAQESATDAAPAAPPPAAEAPPEAAAAPAGPGDSERLTTAEGRIEALGEDYSATKSIVEALAKIKLSGYAQARFTLDQRSGSGLTAAGAPRVIDHFGVRRSRLKATYESSWSRLVLQFDATPSAVTLKDAEAHLIEPWTKKKLTLVIGQTKWPFGYEVLQSSSDREFPERTRVIRAFAASERDRGAKIVGKIGKINFMGGVFDGNGIDNRPAGATGILAVDNDRNKDLVGRVGIDLKWLAAGVSGWWGKTLRSDTFSTAGAVTKVGSTFDRNRLGADVQLYLDLLPIGGTAIKGEVIRGRTWFSSRVEQFGVLAFGYYGLLVQNLGLSNAIAVRYDWFDPARGVETKGASSTNPVGTIGAAFMHYFDESLKITVAYELPMTATEGTGPDPTDNVLTAQLQAKF